MKEEQFLNYNDSHQEEIEKTTKSTREELTRLIALHKERKETEQRDIDLISIDLKWMMNLPLFGILVAKPRTLKK